MTSRPSIRSLLWRTWSRSRDSSIRRPKTAKTGKKDAIAYRDALAGIKAHLDEGLPVRSMDKTDLQQEDPAGACT